MATRDRPRITIDEAKIRERFEGAEEGLPTIWDDKPAGAFTQLVDSLILEGLIVLPEPYRLSLLNDDDVDITGLIVNVEVAGAGWPYISDGWSDIDNYLPRSERPAPPPTVDELLNGLHSIIGRADRCISFAHNARQAMVGPLGDPPAELADAWARYQRGDHVEPYELRALDEWRGERAEAAGF